MGDRYVVAEMLKGDYLLGGEQSGHIIDRDVSTNSDGLATSLLLLQALRQMDVPLAEPPRSWSGCRSSSSTSRPQPGRAGRASAVWAAVDQETRASRAAAAPRAPSGRSRLVRVMAEAPTDDDVDAACARIVAIVEERLGLTRPAASRAHSGIGATGGDSSHAKIGAGAHRCAP